MRPIDADALIAEMHNVILEDGEDRRIFYEVIERQPTIEPQRKKGRWLPDNRPDGGFWVCSECKFPSEAFAANVLYKFCPNCGADMRDDDIPMEYFESGGK